ncbi:MAG: SPOR domain-containing protein [Pseudomonadales bacterium]
MATNSLLAILMAYDFAKRKKKRKKPRKNEVSSRPAWFGTGLASGLFIAFLLQLGNVYFVDPMPSSTLTQVAVTPAIKAPKTEIAKVAEKPTRARFEFYDELQKQEAGTDRNSKAAYQTREDIKNGPSSFLLQAGSFAKERDAQSQRAIITLLNLNAKVEAGSLPSGLTAHRVFVGPYTSRPKMMQARAKLHEQGIETLLMAKQ